MNHHIRTAGLVITFLCLQWFNFVYKLHKLLHTAIILKMLLKNVGVEQKSHEEIACNV